MSPNAIFQRINMHDQSRQGFANGVRETAVLKVRFFIRRMDGMFPDHNLSWHTDDNRIRRCGF